MRSFESCVTSIMFKKFLITFHKNANVSLNESFKIFKLGKRSVKLIFEFLSPSNDLLSSLTHDFIALKVVFTSTFF